MPTFYPHARRRASETWLIAPRFYTKFDIYEDPFTNRVTLPATCHGLLHPGDLVNVTVNRDALMYDLVVLSRARVCATVVFDPCFI